MKTTIILPTMWQDASEFPARLAQSCRGEYLARTSPSFFADPVGRTIGTADAVAISLRRLTGDLATEHNELATALRDKRARQPVSRTDAGNHSREITNLANKTGRLREQFELVNRLMFMYLDATCEAFAGTYPHTVSMTDAGLLVMGTDENEQTFPLAQDHPVRQAGRHIARILAGDDRPEETGIVGELRTLRHTKACEELAAELGKLEPLAMIEDPVLRRLMSLSDSILDRDLGIPSTAYEMSMRMPGALRLTGRAIDLATRIFWHLTRLQDKRLVGGLALRDDWMVVPRETQPDGNQILLGIMGPINGDRTAFRGAAPHVQDCADPGCPIHGKSEEPTHAG